MEDRKSWIAVLVSLLFILFYTETILQPYLHPAKPAQTASPAVAPSPAQANSVAGAQPAASSAVAPAAAANSGVSQPDWRPSSKPHPTRSQIDATPAFSVATDNYIASVSSLGGRLLSFKLKGYKEHLGGEPLVELIHPGTDGILPGGIYLASMNDALVQYTLDSTASNGSSCEAREQAVCTISLVGKLGGDTIRKNFAFKGDSYLVAVSVATTGSLAEQPAWLEWTQWVSADESHLRLNPLSFKVLTAENKVDSTLVTKDTGGVSTTLATQWVSVEGRYFLASLLPFVEGANGYTIHETFSDGSHALHGRVAGAPGSSSFNLYLGPKDSQVLESSGYQLNRNIDLGYFSFLAFPLLWLLRFFHSIVGNYGISIILLTLLIKTAFLPLTLVSFRSARAMQVLAPEIKALRERITDPTQLNQEMMALYKKRGVNPMGGCFPVLIQVPVLIGLYNALLNAIELRHAPFALWIKDLSAPEQLMIGGAAIQLMVLILGVSMFFQQYLTPTPGMDPVQRKVLLAMPVILSVSFLIYPLPAGLVLYWIVNNTISITQQLYIKRDRAISPLPATLLTGAALVVVGYLLTIL